MRFPNARECRDALPWLLSFAAVSVESGMVPDPMVTERAASVVLAVAAIGVGALESRADERAWTGRAIAALVVGVLACVAFAIFDGPVQRDFRPLLPVLALLVIRPSAACASAAPWIVTIAATVSSIGRASDHVFGWTAIASARLVEFEALLPSLEDRRPALLAFTYLGGWPLISMAAALALAAVFAGTRRWRAIAGLAVLVCAVAWNLYAPSMPRTLGCAVVATAIAATSPARAGSLVSPALRRGAVALLAASLAASALLSICGAPLGRTEGAVRLLRGGYSVDLPTLEQSAEPDGASVGRFVQFLERSLPDFAMIDRVESLVGVRLLIVVNLERLLEPSERERVDDFLARGGRLLVFGDHTNIKGVMANTNPLIRRFGTTLRFDSAMPDLRRGHRHWEGSVDPMHAGANVGIDDAELWQVSVGAALDVEAPARPLVVARAGFSDAGDASAPQRAYLGNWYPDRGLEQEGDLILASVASVGNGVVLVYGDTSILQSTSFSDSWSGVAGSIAWLRDDRSSDPPRSAWLGVLAVVAAVAGVVAWQSSRATRLEAAVALLVVAGAVWASGARDATNRSRWHRELPRPSGVAWFDVRHGSPLSRVGDADDGVSTFFRALTIAGKLPLFWHASDAAVAPRRGDVVVVGPGGAPLADDELRQLEQAVRTDGIDLVVVIDHRDTARSDALTTLGGVRTTTLPLGRCPGATTVLGAAPPSLHSAWGLVTTSDDCRPLIEAWEKPVITERRLGAGRVIVISDRQFVANENLARGKYVDRESAEFLIALLRPGR
jgi:hypothetical protein